MFIRKVDGLFDPVEHFDTVPLYQGLFFRRWQEQVGRNVVTLVAEDSDKKVRVYVQCVEYVLPVVGSVWVAALGPLGSFDSAVSEEEFYKELRSLCSEVSPAVSHIRFQKMPIFNRTHVVCAERTNGIFIQPLVEQVFSLDRGFDDITDDFSVNTNRLVRRHEEGKCDGIRIHTERKYFKNHMETVYSLLEESRQKKSVLYSYRCYEALFEELDAKPEYGMLTLGYIEGQEKPVSFVLTVYIDSEAYHLFSGTSSAGYEYNLPTLVFYTVLKEVKEQGIKRYRVGDTGSVLSEDLFILQEEFGGEKVECSVLCDNVISGWRYYLFRFLRLNPVLSTRRLLTRFYRAAEVDLTSYE